MATQASQTAIKSFNVVGKVEDMNDFITNLDPDQTLLTSKFGKTSVFSTEHAWMCDSLRPAKRNATLETVDFETQKANPRRRESNYVQQFLHGYSTSDTTQAIKKYGVRDEQAYQMVKASKEIGRDLEWALVNNREKVLGGDTVEGIFGGIPYFLENWKDATVIQSTGVITLQNHQFVTGDIIYLRAKTGDLDAKYKPNTAYFVRNIDKDTFTIHSTGPKAEANEDVIKPGAAVSNLQVSFSNCLDTAKMASKGEFTFDSLNDAMQAAWKRGGSIDFAVMSGKNKRKASTFTQGTTKTRDMTRKDLVEVVDVIETDFGRIDLIAHRMYEDDVVDLFEQQYWKMGYLIPFHKESVPRKGTYKEEVITGIATLECTAPIANARLYNISK